MAPTVRFKCRFPVSRSWWLLRIRWIDTITRHTVTAFFGIGSSGSRVAKTVPVENDGENNRRNLSTWVCNEQQDSNTRRTVCRTFNTSKLVATFFVIKMIEGPGSNYEPPQTLRLIDCLVLRLWMHHGSAATPVESSSRYSEMERSTSHSCLVLSAKTAMPALP